MSIAHRPNGNHTTSPPVAQERAAEAFIQGATKAAAGESGAGGRITPIMLRIGAALLRRVNSAARRRGISRSAGLTLKVSPALDAEEA